MGSGHKDHQKLPHNSRSEFRMCAPIPEDTENRNQLLQVNTQWILGVKANNLLLEPICTANKLPKQKYEVRPLALKKIVCFIHVGLILVNSVVT